MGDMAEGFKEMKEASQSKRASNRESSTSYLGKQDIPFTSKNNGAHLIVEGPDCFIDFWPSTGRWKSRKGKEGFGVRNLVAFINTKGTSK